MNSTNAADLSDFVTPLAIAVRAHLHRSDADGGKRRRDKSELPPIEPSDYVIIFDTETTTDPAQSLRFGVYQLRNGTALDEAGFFYDPEGVTEGELALLRSYAAARGFKVMTVAEFIEKVLFGIAYELGATIVGFNLPFDLSRLAIGHGPARTRSMRGGFTFKLSTDPRRPHLQIKHLTRTASIFQFATPAHREFRRRGQRVPASKGYFVDARTLAAALTNRSFTLASLADFLEAPHRKLDTDEHGGPLTTEYLTYAANDVQVTWECFAELRQRYERLNLTKTPIHKVLSVASIGKAALRQMGIRPWRELQPEFPRDLLGIIMSTYFGGRSEAHLRRVITPVIYCDFLSMYPTVCTLMQLWRFVTAKRMTWRDATVETRSFLDRVTLADLRDPATWLKLHVIVQIEANGDIFPVRAEYGHESHYSTGTNGIRGDVLWRTLADCIASKLRTGKAPKVLKAILFEPGEIQDGLTPIEIPVAIPGHAAYRIDPVREDFYRRGIDLRNEVKAKLKTASDAEADALDTLQEFLKILINATSYGIFLELIVKDLVHAEDMRCYGPAGKPFQVRLDKFEEPGSNFHPLLGTLITGAARLMLAIAELLALDAGLDWAMCDTDSLAIAKPETLGWDEFENRVRKIQKWFTPLNPYASKEPLLKVEDVNYQIGGSSGRVHPLYCLAISAKRYALFNQEPDGRIIIRKASAHGLGHLRAPYDEKNAPPDIPPPAVPLDEIGVECWQYGLWHRIIEAARNGPFERPDYSSLPGFNQPAVCRHAATTPLMTKGFRRYNRGKPYRQQIRPFNFMLTFLPDRLSEPPIEISPTASPGKLRARKVKLGHARVLAPFHTEIREAIAQAFDRDTGKPVPASRLKTYRRVLGTYHLHPEAKFENGDWGDFGPTKRRLIQVTAIHHIGKEAHRWEEEFLLGEAPDTRLVFGIAPSDERAARAEISQVAKDYSRSALARAAGMSRQHLTASLSGKATMTQAQLAKLQKAAAALRAIGTEAETVLAKIRVFRSRVPVRRMAEMAEMDPGQFSRIVNRERRLTRGALAKLKKVVALYDAISDQSVR